MQALDTTARAGAPPAGVLIPTRSEKQAMDWSLALASQDIACVIRPPTEGLGWSLEVDPGDAQRALRTLRLYHTENRGWRAAFVPSDSTLSFHWGAMLWCFLILMISWVEEAPGSRLAQVGMMVSSSVAEGQWWRPITATFLHAGIDHLASNLTTGFVLIGLAMGRFGPGAGLLATLLSGIFGYLTSSLFRPYTNPGLGASGVVMAALGMLTVSLVADARAHRLAPATVVRGVLGGVALFILLGTSPRSDVTAHTSGFAWGAILAFGLSQLPRRWFEKPRFDVACAVGYFALSGLAWAVALR